MLPQIVCRRVKFERSPSLLLRNFRFRYASLQCKNNASIDQRHPSGHFKVAVILADSSSSAKNHQVFGEKNHGDTAEQRRLSFCIQYYVVTSSAEHVLWVRDHTLHCFSENLCDWGGVSWVKLWFMNCISLHRAIYMHWWFGPKKVLHCIDAMF